MITFTKHITVTLIVVKLLTCRTSVQLQTETSSDTPRGRNNFNEASSQSKGKGNSRYSCAVCVRCERLRIETEHQTWDKISQKKIAEQF